MSDIDQQVSPIDAFWSVAEQDTANPNLHGASMAMVKSTGRAIVHFTRRLFPDRSAE